MNICVYGAASDNIADIFKKAGEQLGEELARRGHNLIFGGGAAGMMGAAARGASRGGGHITSVAPSFFDVDGVLYPECDEYIFTETMGERKQIFEDISDAFVISPGGVGTFDEFFELLTLRQLNRHQKPMAILNTEGYFGFMLAMMRNAADLHFMTPLNFDLFYVSDRVEDILDYLEHPGDVYHGTSELRDIVRDKSAIDPEDK